MFAVFIAQTKQRHDAEAHGFGSEVDSVLHALKFIVQAGGGVLPKALEMP